MGCRLGLVEALRQGKGGGVHEADVGVSIVN